MRRQPSPPDLSDYVAGNDISLLDWQSWHIARSEHGHPVFYLGYASRRSIDTVFAVSGAARVGYDRVLRQFLKVNRGCITATSFFEGPIRYKVLTEYAVHLPAGNKNYFGVFNREKEEYDSNLTRQIFGITFEDLEALLQVYGGVVDGPPIWDHSYPRITFSRTRSNSCDLTDVYIPPNFPYIALTDSQYFKGHVSLHGFSVLLAFLCDRAQQRNAMPGNNLYQEMLVHGANQEVLDFVIESATYCCHHLKRDEISRFAI